MLIWPYRCFADNVGHRSLEWWVHTDDYQMAYQSILNFENTEPNLETLAKFCYVKVSYNVIFELNIGQITFPNQTSS